MYITLFKSVIAINPPIAEKRPMSADLFDPFEIDFAVEKFFPVLAGPGDDHALGITYK